MRLSVLTSLLLCVVISTHADPQYGYDYGYNPFDSSYNYFRSGYPQPSYEENAADEPISMYARSFPMITLTLATTTYTSVITTSTTCTTSLSSLNVCSPSGRRRRGLSLQGDRKGRGLFYNDEEVDDAGSIFLPFKPAEVPLKEEQVRETREAQSSLIPFMIQPGFQAPEGMRSGRFFFAFATVTRSTTTTSTYTASLTAICSSTTGFQSCSGSG